MQIVVLCIFVEGSGDVNCVVGIYNDIADLIAGGNFSCMKIAVAAAGNGDGNCLIGQQDFTGSGVSGIIDLNLHFALGGIKQQKAAGGAGHDLALYGNRISCLRRKQKSRCKEQGQNQTGC